MDRKTSRKRMGFLVAWGALAAPQAGFSAQWRQTLADTSQFAAPLIADAHRVYAYGMHKRTLLYSDDRGVHWESMGPKVPDEWFPQSEFALANGTFWLEDGLNGTYSWAPGQAAWTPRNAGRKDTAVLALGSMGDMALAGTNHGLWAWDESAGSWRSLNDSVLKEDVYIMGIRREGNLLFLVNNRGDSFRGVRQGTGFQWTAGPMRRPEAVVRLGSALFATCLYYPTPQGNHHLVRSDDEGLTWSVRDAGLPESRRATGLAVIGASLFVNVQESPFGIFRSDDEGLHWTADTLGLPAGAPFKSLVAVGDTLIGASESGIWILPQAAPLGLRKNGMPGRTRDPRRPDRFFRPKRGGTGKAFRANGRLEGRIEGRMGW